MYTPERRQPSPVAPERMLSQLEEAQRDVLRLLEHAGWQLRFVRQPPSRPPLPVIFASDAWAVIRPDGSIDRAPHLRIRHPGF